ncbi:carboxylating nicotinate-nucleotide diphosphorylase [Myxococcota bacterium]|nr:carboxylating nicotinate-nucleotide diphosphorylase [Myxococcota bacterium]
MDSPPAFPAPQTWHPLVSLALAEDVGPGDVTTPLVLDASVTGRAIVEARQTLIVCGLPLVRHVFETVDASLDVTTCVKEGDVADPAEPLLEIDGSLASILAAERTALNFLGRMSGVSTYTRRYVEAVAGTDTRIVDTRKTLPGWRALDKYATAVGGGLNHRSGLFDGILLKDNHIAAAGGIEAAVKSALDGAPAGLRVQVEVESEHDAQVAVSAGADFLLLDNLPPASMASIVRSLADRAILEASGGVNFDNVVDVAQTGVHRISIGALTHSAPAADVALELSNAPGGVRK